MFEFAWDAKARNHSHGADSVFVFISMRFRLSSRRRYDMSFHLDPLSRAVPSGAAENGERLSIEREGLKA